MESFNKVSLVEQPRGPWEAAAVGGTDNHPEVPTYRTKTVISEGLGYRHYCAWTLVKTQISAQPWEGNS